MADRFMGLKEFADHIGRAPSYVTKLRNADRLVMTKTNKVDVKKSLELIEATAGTRDDVAERHAAARTERKETLDSVTPSPDDKKSPDGVEISENGLTLKDAQRIKAFAESRRVAALADREEMERDKLAGDLIAREDVDAAMKFIGATVRGLLDVFPDQTAPIVVAVNDMDECHALLTDACRNVLIGLGDAIERQRHALDRNGA